MTKPQNNGPKKRDAVVAQSWWESEVALSPA